PPREEHPATHSASQTRVIALLLSRGPRCGDPALGPGSPLEFTPAKAGAGAGMSGGCCAVGGGSLKLKHFPGWLDSRRQRATSAGGANARRRHASRCVGFSRSRRQALPGPAPRLVIAAAQVTVVGRIGLGAPLRGGQSPLARPIVATSPARRLSHLLLRRSRAGQVGNRQRRYIAVCRVGGAGVRGGWLRRQ